MACASFSLCSLVGVAEMLNAVTKTAAAYGVNACLLATRRRWHTMTFDRAIRRASVCPKNRKKEDVALTMPTAPKRGLFLGGTSSRDEVHYPVE